MKEIGRIVQALPWANGYGFASPSDSARLRHTWTEVIAELLIRAHSRTQENGLIPQKYFDLAWVAIEALKDYFSAVSPVAFLHDTTTKNVIIERGNVSGIVDVDDLCFGDSLLTPALTKTSLIAAGQTTDYVDMHWCESLSLGRENLQVLQFYVGIFCLDLVSEMSRQFGDKLIPIEPLQVNRLLEAARSVFSRLND